MSAEVKCTKHRWRQFTLRGLLRFMTLIVLLLVAWRACVEPYHQQRRMMALIEQLGGRYSTEAGGPTWLPFRFGSSFFRDVTFVDLADCDEPESYLPNLRHLPRLQVLILGGQGIGDAQLQGLQELPALQALVLDSTCAKRSGVQAFRRRHPHAGVYQSHRRAAASLKKLTGAWVSGPKIALQRASIGSEHIRATRVTYHVWNRALCDADLAPLEGLPDLEDVSVQAGGAATITDAGMAVFSHLRKLKRLYIPGVLQITDAALDHVKDLPSLEDVSLHCPRLTDAAVLRLAGIPKLKSLSLYGTRITDAALKHLTNCKNLRSLSISAAQITDQGMAYLSNMPLESLCLTKMAISDTGFAHIANNKTVQYFTLHQTVISDAGLAAISRLSSLQSLYLSQTNITNDALRSLPKLPKLYALLLFDEEGIDAKGLTHLQHCPRLRDLYLFRTSVTDAELAEIAKIKTLRYLSAQAPQVSDEGIKQLRALPRLWSLSLSNRPAGNVFLQHPDYVREFFDTLP